MRYFVTLIIAIFISLKCPSQAFSKIDWHQDIDFLSQQLIQKHPNFFTVRSKTEFLEGLESIKSQLPYLLDLNIAIKLQQLIASFGDSHTYLNLEQFLNPNKFLPIHTYWFSDGLYIIHTTPENYELPGYQIKSINGISLNIIKDSLSSLVSAENNGIVLKSVPPLIRSIEILKHFGFVQSNEVELELINTQAKTRKYVISPARLTRQNRIMFEPVKLASYLKNENAWFVDYYLSKEKIYVLQYNKCWSKELELKYGEATAADNLPSFQEFETKVFKTLKNKSVDKIIFDLRFNSGGNSLQGTFFIESLASYLQQNPQIKLFVIVGRSTFSAALLNVMDLKRLTNAVFVGEETGGATNHFGETKSLFLPSSGLKIHYSTKYFKREEGKGNTFIPDKLVEESFLHFKNGIDPALEWIKMQ